MFLPRPPRRPPAPGLLVLRSMRTRANLAAELSFHYNYLASKLEEKTGSCRSSNAAHFLPAGCRFGADLGLTIEP